VFDRLSAKQRRRPRNAVPSHRKRPLGAISGLVIARQDRHRRTIIAVFGISIQIELCSIADRHAA